VKRLRNIVHSNQKKLTPDRYIRTEHDDIDSVHSDSIIFRQFKDSAQHDKKISMEYERVHEAKK
jgi:hypothetical protein